MGRSPVILGPSDLCPAEGVLTTPVDETRERTVLLLGSLNVGKTTLFNRLCQKNLEVSNYPGTSVAIGRGTVSQFGAPIHLIDTPGIETIAPASEDERITRSLLLQEKPDVIALVCDGRNLQKSLLLACEIAEYGTRLVLDINVMDEAAQRGIEIDDRKLSALTGLPVTLTVATEGKGVDLFRKALPRARLPLLHVTYPGRMESAISLIGKLLPDTAPFTRAIGTALLSENHEVKRHIVTRFGAETGDQIDGIIKTLQTTFNRPTASVILESRMQAVDRILSEVLTVSPPKTLPFSDTMGRWMRQPLTGFPIAAMVVLGMYLFVGRWGAGTLVDLVQHRLFDLTIVPFIQGLLTGAPHWIGDALVGRFGLVSLGLSLSIGVVVPVLITFFFAFAVLEDSGYLPRLSVLFDQLLRRIGLTGKGVLPLSMGFSCVTMAILTTRILETKRERIISTLLLVLGIPCGPVFAVTLVVLAGLPIAASVTVFGVIAIQIAVIGFLANKILPGGCSDFILELPPIRLPKFRALVSKTAWRTWWFVKEALPFFLAATFTLYVLDSIGVLAFIDRAGKPILTGLLGLPPQSTEVVIMSFLRKDVAAGLLGQFFARGVFDGVQVVVSLLLIAFLTPCVNAIVVMFKELGWRIALSIMGFLISYALLVGAVVNFVCRLFNVTFSG